MPKYDVYANYTVSQFLGTFEAKDEDDAEEQALKSPGVGVALCHYCNRENRLGDFECTEFEVESDNEENDEC